MKKPSFVFLAVILGLGFIVRLHKISEPVADWHSFRQSDTAAVAQVYVNEGYNFLYPRYYDISNVQSGLDNPNGYRFVEFPLYNFLHAFFYKSLGILSFEVWGRLINIIFSLLTGLVVFLLLKKYISNLAAYVGLILFMFLPYSIYYSRVILPDVMMTSFIMLGIYFFDRYLEKNRSKKAIFYSLSLLFTSLSFLVKPFALFYLLPLAYLAYERFRLRMFLQWNLYLYAGLSFAPLAAWRSWISQFPEGVPASNWLFNGNGIRFRPAFFRWIFFERIMKLIFGYAGFILLAVSVFHFRFKKSLLFLFFGLSSLAYLFVIATGNVQHDYYQIIIMPTLCMVSAIGADVINNFVSKKTNSKIAIGVLGLIIAVSIYFSWQQVKDYFNINDRGMVAAAAKADEILPEDAIIIAPYDGSTTFLNLTKRRGWPVFQSDISILIEKGAQYMVIANPTADDLSGFGTEYEVIASSDNYLILKLK